MRLVTAKIIKVIVFLVFCLPVVVHSAPPEDDFSARIVAFDPPAGTELDAYDKLYLHIAYESDRQVRFKVVPLRNGLELEYGLMTSSTMVWPSGTQDALAWISFSNATRIDEVHIVVLDSDWHKLGLIGLKLDISWNSTPVEVQRKPVEWVEKLIRKNRLRQEFAFDPNPQKQEVVYDAFFYASVILIPLYLLLQIRFLYAWRGRWRELATVPIISVTPLIVMALLGLGIELRLWIIFIFRGMPFALLYLLALWFAKQMSEKKKADTP